MDNKSLSHSRYNCTYHIVFIPKYRRKAMFGSLRREVGERHKGILLTPYSAEAHKPLPLRTARVQGRL